jgi:hypothetical protein
MRVLSKPNHKQQGIECHSVLGTESSPFLWIPAFGVSSVERFRRNDDKRGKPRGINPE